MRLYISFLLLILLSTAVARYEEDDDQSEEETNADRRDVKRYFDFLRQHGSQKSDPQKQNKVDKSKKTAQKAANSTLPIIENPVRISVFNDGDFSAHLKLNYILDNRQAEQEISSPIIYRQERTLFLPHTVTYIRIRITAIGILKDKYIVDEQIRNLQNVTEKCYILAGTNSYPVYGLCPMVYAKLLKLWNGNS